MEVPLVGPAHEMLVYEPPQEGMFATRLVRSVTTRVKSRWSDNIGPD